MRQPLRLCGQEALHATSTLFPQLTTLSCLKDFDVDLACATPYSLHIHHQNHPLRHIDVRSIESEEASLTKNRILVREAPSSRRRIHRMTLISASSSLGFLYFFPRYFGVFDWTSNCVRISFWSKDLDFSKGLFECTNPFVSSFRCQKLRDRPHRKTYGPFRAPCCALLLYLMSAESIIFSWSGKSDTGHS